MSEHSEHYHDADRNKPLPGAPVSSKEEVLQTLLDAARGEITALTEANKLLAAQVAGPVLGSFDLDADLLGAIARGWCAKANANKVMDANLAFAIHHEVKALLDLRAAKVSARAADAPSEPSELVLRLRNIVAEDVTPYFCVNVPKDLLRSAADALDSQPTEPDAVDAQRYRYLRDHGDTEGQPCIWLGAHWYGGSNGVGFSLDDAIDARISSSQPTDGEVRNG